VVVKCSRARISNQDVVELYAEVVFKETLSSVKDSLNSRVLWRGYLGVYDSKGHRFNALDSICELVAAKENALSFAVPVASPSGGMGRRRNKNQCTTPLCFVRSSYSLKVLAHLGRHQASPMLAGVELRLRTSADPADSKTRRFLDDESFGRENVALVVRLDYSTPEAIRKPEEARPSAATMGEGKCLAARTTIEWRASVLDGKIERDLDENVNNSDVKMNSLFLVVFDDGGKTDRRVSQVYQSPISKHVRHFQYVERAAYLLDPALLPLPACLAQQRSTPALKVDQHEADRLRQKLLRQAEDFNEDDQNDDDQNDDDQVWPEMRALVALDHAKKNERKHLGSNTMTPSGDFVILEPKEILKLLSDSAKKPLEPLKPKRRPLIVDEWKAMKADWPEAQHLEHPALIYNRDRQAEILDAELQRLQRLHVGLGVPETASSTNAGKDAKPYIVSKAVNVNAASKEKPVAKRKPLAVVQSRLVKQESSSSIGSRASTKEELFKRKVRVAVFDALAGEGVSQRHPLFKACFRRLFDVCQTFYAKDASVANVTATSAFLAQVAASNVKLAIASEEALSKAKKR